MNEFAIVPETFKLVTGTTTCFTVENIEKSGTELDLCGYPGETVHGNIIFKNDEKTVLNLDDGYYVSQYHPLPSVRLSGDGFTFNYVKPVIDDDRFKKADIICEDSWIELSETGYNQIFFSYTIPEKSNKNIRETINIFYRDIKDREKKLASLTLKIKVYSYKPTENKFFTDIWLHPTHIARHHNVKMWSEKHFELIERYVKKLSELNQKAVTLIMSEIPWRGQYCNTERRSEANMFEFSMVKVTRAANRRFVYDFSTVERILEIYNKYGCDEEISVIGLSGVWDAVMPGTKKSDHPDGILVRYIDKSDGKAKFMTRASEIDGYIKAVEKFFSKKSLAGKVRLVADEPADTEKYLTIIKRLQKNTPSFKFKSAVCTLDFISSISPIITDLAPSLSVLSNEYDNIIKIKKEKKDGRMLYYVCCNPPYPNTFIRSDLCESFVLPLIVSLTGLDGFLRWSFTAWPDNPEEETRYFAWPAGDLFLVYPGKDGYPKSTIRFECLKKGIELYGILEDLKKKCGTSAVKEALSFVFKQKDIRKFFDKHNPKPWEELYSIDYSDYNKLKSFALEKLTEK